MPRQFLVDEAFLNDQAKQLEVRKKNFK